MNFKKIGNRSNIIKSIANNKNENKNENENKKSKTISIPNNKINFKKIGNQSNIIKSITNNKNDESKIIPISNDNKLNNESNDNEFNDNKLNNEFNDNKLNNEFRKSKNIKYDPIYTYINLLIKHYNKKNIRLFNSDYIKFNELVTSNNNYKYNQVFNSIVQLINIINLLFNSNVDFKKQLTNYEQTPNILFTPSIIAPKLQIKTKATIKLVYLQYLLLFDISKTNGLFIETYLEIASSILKANNNKLKYPEAGKL
jgi:hypothetical protein